MIVKKIHWLGVGLSSPPGILYLSNKGYKLDVWNRTPEKASLLLSNKIIVKRLDLNKLRNELNENDLIVSMLPASNHIEIAKIAVEKKSHLLTSSYYDVEYEEFHNQFTKNQNIFMCEAGLDPGIDHLLAHKIINDFKALSKDKIISSIKFKSMCGGLPLTPNTFKYKFSWSPIGVLKALKTPAKYIKEFREKHSSKPYQSTSNINFLDEEFEIYPNRDSLPYLQEYQLNEYLPVIESFERGTIRLKGWTKAWDQIFKKIEESENFEKLSSELWENNQYKYNEKDRVLLYVNLLAKDQNQKIIFDRTMYIDESRDIKNSTMAQCVSYTVASTIERIMESDSLTGIHRIFHDNESVLSILENLEKLGISIKQL